MGQALQYTNMITTVTELLIDQGKYFGMPINDVEKKQADINFVNSWADDAAQQLKIAVDRDILGTIYADPAAENKGLTAGKISASINLGVTGTPVSLSSSTILDKVIELGQVLDEQNMPETDRWLLLPPWAAAKLKMSPLQQAYMTGDSTSPVRNGKIGSIDRFTIYTSNLLASVKDGSDICYNILGGHKSALTFASQITESELVDNPYDFGKLMRGLQVYGFKVVKPESMFTLYAKIGAEV